MEMPDMGSRKRIVLIDDDADDQEIFRSACGRLEPGVEVIIYEGGETALKAFAAGMDLPDVVFLDLNMPRFNGLEVLSVLRNSELLKGVPVIVYTTSFDSVAEAKCFSLGAVSVIEKPNSFERLCSILEGVLHTHA